MHGISLGRYFMRALKFWLEGPRPYIMNWNWKIMYYWYYLFWLTHWFLGDVAVPVIFNVQFSDCHHVKLILDACMQVQQDLADDMSTLVQVMAWCHQAPSHYLNQWWPGSTTPLYWVTRNQWVNFHNSQGCPWVHVYSLVSCSSHRCLCIHPLRSKALELLQKLHLFLIYSCLILYNTRKTYSQLVRQCCVTDTILCQWFLSSVVEAFHKDM